jgi:hypothetical protein
MYRSFPSSRRIRICAIRTRAPTARRASTRSDFSADPTTIASVRATGDWLGKNCSRYRPPSQPPSSPSLREFFYSKRKENLFVVVFLSIYLPLVFPSIRFDSSCGHQAAARSILSRLGALPSSGGIIRIIIHASSKGFFFPFLSLSLSLAQSLKWGYQVNF